MLYHTPAHAMLPSRAPPLAVLALALTAHACATSGALRNAAPARCSSWRCAPPSDPGSAADRRIRLVSMARRLVGQRSYRDCTEVVVALYQSVGLRLTGAGRPGDNGVTALYRYAARHGRIYSRGVPLPGDLVFFTETYDRNRDGRLNDGLTHVGIVDAIRPDGTVELIHRVSRGIVRSPMNLRVPGVRRDPRSGQPLNDYLRAATPRAPHALTGQLFVAYASLLGEADERWATGLNPPRFQGERGTPAGSGPCGPRPLSGNCEQSAKSRRQWRRSC